MLRKLSYVFLAAILSGLSVSAQAWESFSPSGGNFSIKFPGTPKNTNAKKNVNERVFNQHLYMYSTPGGKAAYMLQYFDVEENHRKSRSTKEWLDGLQERVSVRGNRTLLKRSDIRVSGYKARRMVLKDNSREIYFHAQLVLAKNRMYTVLVVTDSRSSSNASVSKFMNSFRILKATSRKTGSPSSGDFKDLQ